MIAQNLENINVTSFASMPTPEELHAKLPLTDKASETVTKGRADLRAILERKDKRLFVVWALAPSMTRSRAWTMRAA